MNTAAVTADGNIVLAGNTFGNWAGDFVGSADAAAVKLHSNGTVLWRWQVQNCYIQPAGGLAGGFSSADMSQYK